MAQCHSVHSLPRATVDVSRLRGPALVIRLRVAGPRMDSSVRSQQSTDSKRSVEFGRECPRACQRTESGLGIEEGLHSAYTHRAHTDSDATPVVTHAALPGLHTVGW